MVVFPTDHLLLLLLNKDTIIRRYAMINTQQREAYRQALEAWKLAAREAQKIKDRLYGAPTKIDDMYLVTSDDLNYLQREYEHFQRLSNVAQQL
jgi:hypothetical protein